MRLQDKVRSRLAAWRRIGAPSHVLRWLHEGVRAEWIDGRPPAPFHHGVTTFTPEERHWLTGERDRCLGTGAWRRATCFDFVSRAFIVEHKGKRRLVIDFRHVNLHHVKRGCRFESLSRLRRMARRHDWVFSIDLKDAYHNLGVHPDDQDYFTFALQTDDGTEYFSTSALSFGWCMSPWYFTQLMKPVVSYFRNPTVGQRPRFGQREIGPLGEDAPPLHADAPVPQTPPPAPPPPPPPASALGAAAAEWAGTSPPPPPFYLPPGLGVPPPAVPAQDDALPPPPLLAPAEDDELPPPLLAPSDAGSSSASDDDVASLEELSAFESELPVGEQLHTADASPWLDALLWGARAAGPAAELRRDADGELYSAAEFAEWYGGAAEWCAAAATSQFGWPPDRSCWFGGEPPPPPTPTYPPGLGLVAPPGAMLASPTPPPPEPPPPPTGDPADWHARHGRLRCGFKLAVADEVPLYQSRYEALPRHLLSAAQWDALPESLEELDALIAALPCGATDEQLADALSSLLRPCRSLPGPQPWRKPPPSAPPPRTFAQVLCPSRLPEPLPLPPPPSRAAQRRVRRRRGPRLPCLPRAARPAEIGCRVLPWLDDFAFFKQGTHAVACEHRDHVFATLVDLGLTRAPDKGQPEPSHVLEDHLGYCIDTARGLFLLTSKREAKLRTLAAALLGHAARHRRHVRTRVLAGFAGLAQASSLAVPLARFWLRSVYDDIVAGGHRWSGFTRLSRQGMADIAEWRRLRGSRHVGRAIWLAPDSAVGHVDAGPYGWGGQLDYQTVLPPAWGFWSPAEAELHITFRELRAVKLFVQHYLESLRGRRLLLYEDNQAVVAILTNLTTRSPLLMAELREIIELLAEGDISLRATYIRSAANKVADYYSRIARPHEYAIVRDVLSRVEAWWGECTVDAFASAATTQVHRYWAESFDDLGAEAVDAFAQTWAGERAWVHPPPHLLPQVAQLLRADSAIEAFVCAPFWPGEAWYGELLSLCAERVTFPAGSFERVAPDAPDRLESWPCTVFRVLPVAAT